MAKIKCLLFYSLLSISLLSCAQSKYGIKNIYATYRIHLPGNIAVDENGDSLTPPDTVNIVYIEAASDIVWSEAWKNGKQYSIIKTLITESPFDAGTNKFTNEKIMLHSTPGNKLWMLQLVATEKNVEVPQGVVPGEILLEGSFNGRKIKRKIMKQTEINSIPTP